MKKNKNKEELIKNYLSELVRTAHQVLSPQSNVDELKYFMDINNRENFIKKYPKCFEALKYIDGREKRCLPLCNMSGKYDPHKIKFTIIFIEKIKKMNKKNIDFYHMNKVLLNLYRLYNKYTKPTIRPTNIAILKGNSTKTINNIKNYLDNIRNKVNNKRN